VNLFPGGLIQGVWCERAWLAGHCFKGAYCMRASFEGACLEGACSEAEQITMPLRFHRGLLQNLEEAVYEREGLRSNEDYMETTNYHEVRYQAMGINCSTPN
jgi:hypothetical protein